MEARYWKGNDITNCLLCPHHCNIPEGGRGICGVRMNQGGILHAEGYGIYPAIHLDPIEKKPLNHFLPGSNILSLGSVGCNLNCLHCQNWSLARAKPPGMDGYHLSVEELVSMASRRKSVGVAFTYNEPTINFEYIMDAGPKLRKNGSKVVLVTNGYLEEDPWNELMETTDAANIDVKAFTEEFYREVTGGTLSPVLENVISAYEKGVHIEIAYLVIPGYNDDEQVDDFMDWVIRTMSVDVPVHFNRFHPDHRMTDVPPTPPETLLGIRERAIKKGLANVFIGNMGGRGLNDTVCPDCSNLLVSRDGFFTPRIRMKNGKCPQCGREVYGVWE